MSVTFDTYAWIEYFLGTKKGTKVKKYVDGAETIYAPSFCLLEFKAKYLKEKQAYQERIEFIKKRSQIIPLTGELALDAADFKIKKGLHASDSVVYATSKAMNAKLLTGDAHFFGFEDVELL